MPLVANDGADDHAGRAAAWAVAAVLLGQALQISNGSYDLRGLVGVGLALVAAGAGSLGVVPRRLRNSWRSARVILAIGLGLQFFELLTSAADDAGARPATDIAWFLRAVVAAAVVAGVGFTRRSWVFHLTLPLLAVLHLMLAAWMIARVPHPGIDTFMVQQAASQDILAGKNPYETTYPDIYGGHSPFYAPGMSVDGKLTFGFAYPPLSLFLAVPGYALAHDVRYALELALVLAALLIAYARGGRIAALAAALLLFTPRVFFIVREAWTEPFVLLLFGAAVFCACRRPALIPWPLGLLFAVKPYAFAMSPFVFLLAPRRGTYWRLIAGTALVALAVTLPLALRDFHAFLEAVIMSQLHYWPRMDSLSYATLWAHVTGKVPPGSLTLVVAGLCGAVALWRSPRTPAGFAGAVAFTFAALFAVASRSFCNYYFFVIGALCCAVAVAENENDAEAVNSATRTIV
jgi:hypothetical protein